MRDEQETKASLLQELNTLGRRVWERQGGKCRIWITIALLAVACISLCYFHVILGTGTVVTHIFYVPIILAAVWWKRKGLLVALFSSGFLIFCHVFLRPDVAIHNDYVRALMFIVTAFVVAELSRRVSKERAVLRTANKQLSASEQQLKAINQQLRLNEQQLVDEINERNRIEENLKESEQRFRSLVEATSDWVWEVDQNGIYTYSSPKVKELLGYEPEELIGKTPFDLMLKDEAERLSTIFRDRVASQKPFEQLENVNLHKDGRLIVLETSGVPIFDASGDFVGYRGIDRDITERKEAEDKIKQAVEEWSQTFDAISDFVFVQDKDFRLIKVNKSICDFLKVKAEDLVGKKCYEVLHQSDKPWTSCPLVNALQDRRPHTEEVYDPNIGVPLLISASPIFDESGELTGAVHIAKDITERKKAEEALREAELRYRTLFESIPIGVGLATREGQILACNKSVLQTTGYSDAQIRQINLNDIYQNPQERELLLKKLYTDGLVCDFEVQLRRKDNTIFWASLTVVPFPFVGEDVLLTVVQDISEHKKAEESLKSEKKRAEQYLNIAEVGMVIVNPDENISLINKKGCKILGYKQEELIGKNWFDILVPQRIRNEVRGVFRKLMAGDVEPVEYYENPLLTKDGDERLIAFHNSVIRDLDGKVAGTLSSAEDITERKQVEEKCENLAKFPGENPNPVLRISKDCTILYANDASSPVLETWERKVGERLPNDCCKRVKEVFDSACVSSFEFKCNNGRIFSMTLSPIVEEGYANAYGLDITERKKAEEVLWKSELKYRGLSESLNELVYRADPKTLATTYVNVAVEKLYGYNVEEWLRDPSLWENSIHPVDKERALKEFEEARRKLKSAVVEYRIIRKDKSVRYVKDHVSLEKGPEGEIVSLNGIMYDITEQKEAEEQISKLSFAVEQSIDGIAIGDLEPKILYANDAFARMHGYTPEEMVGMPATKLHNKEQMDEHKKALNQLRTRGSWQGEIARIRRDGTAFLAYVSLTLLKDSEGIPTGTLAVIRDITESKRREEALSTYRENMVQAEELASVGTLSATLAHELTQPLTVIRLSIQNSLAELEKISCPGTVAEDLTEGLSKISIMISMLDRFRNFARMSTKRTVSEVDFKAVAERIVKLLDEGAWRAKVTLRVEGMEKLPLIYSYERDLEQLFFTLIENAIQAADGKKNRQVIISGAVRDEHIELQFSDNCDGIAPENLDRIFEPFFTTKRAEERTGLGLCVVERIVSQLGGEIRVESKLGKGSTFFVTLPINRGEK